MIVDTDENYHLIRLIISVILHDSIFIKSILFKLCIQLWRVSVCIPTCDGVLIGQLVGIRFILPQWSKDWIQVTGLGSKHLCLLSHLDRVSRNSYAWWCSLYQPPNPKYTSHLLLYHSITTIGETGIHGTTLKIQLKDDSNLIHITTVNIDYSWLYYPFWTHTINNALMPQSN